MLLKIILVLACLFTAVPALTQSTDQLTPGLIHIYTRFETPESTPSDFRRWRAFRDNNPLREHEVYQIAGYEDEFDEARRYRRITIALLIASPAVFFSSFYILFMEYLVSETPIIAPALMISSTVAFIIGLTRIGKRWSTWSEISPIVDDYNVRLMEELRNGRQAGP